MTLATKNGSLIVKDGKIAENCGCCQPWHCYQCPPGYEAFPGRYGTIAGGGFTINLGENQSSGDSPLADDYPASGSDWEQLRTEITYRTTGWGQFPWYPGRHQVWLGYKKWHDDYQSFPTYRSLSASLVGVGKAGLISLKDPSVADGTEERSFELDVFGNLIASYVKYGVSMPNGLAVSYSTGVVVSGYQCTGTLRDVVVTIEFQATWEISMASLTSVDANIYTFVSLADYRQDQIVRFDTRQLTPGMTVTLSPLPGFRGQYADLTQGWYQPSFQFSPYGFGVVQFSDVPQRDMSLVFTPSELLLPAEC